MQCSSIEIEKKLKDEVASLQSFKHSISKPDEDVDYDIAEFTHLQKRLRDMELRLNKKSI